MKYIYKIKNKIILFIILIVNMIFLSSCTMRKDVLDTSFFALDTMINIKVYDYEDKNKAIEYLNTCKNDITNFENLMSKTIDASDVSKLNDKKIQYDDVDDDLKEIIDMAIDYQNNISNLFDIYIGNLVDIWDEAKGKEILPDDNDIKNMLNNIKYDNDMINDIKSYIDNNKNKMDLGGVAKGYIADKLSDETKNYDIISSVINLGGNVYVVGDKYGEPFKVGINKPFFDGEIVCSVDCIDKSVVTSGIYQRYYKVDGDDNIYHHIIDKRTGYPSRSDIISASIICDNSCLSDMLATTCVIVGVEESKRIIDKAKKYYNKDIKLILIDKDYNVIKYGF